MELKLNVYTDETLKVVEKTYISNDFELSLGVAEDILDLIDIDMFAGNMNEEDTILQLIKIVIKGKESFKKIVKNIFVGITNDELRRVNVKQFVKALYDVVVYTIAGLTEVSPEKN